MKNAYISLFLSITFVFLSSSSTPAHSAHIFNLITEFGENRVYIEGEITEGDFIKFKHAVAEGIRETNSPLEIYLNSSGGNIEEALKIGVLIRELLATTNVAGKNIVSSESDLGKSIKEKQLNLDETYLNWGVLPLNHKLTPADLTVCYSSCVLIFLSGAEKFLTDNQDNRINSNTTKYRKIIPSLGIHRHSFDKTLYANLTPSEAQLNYRAVEKSLRDYLDYMGASANLSERMLRSSSESIELVTSENFAKYFNKTEPYYEEYLIAKCNGLVDDRVFNEKELSDYRLLSEKRIGEYTRLLSENTNSKNASHVFKDFVPDGFDKEYADYLSKKIQSRNLDIQKCKFQVLTKTQIDWLKQLK